MNTQTTQQTPVNESIDLGEKTQTTVFDELGVAGISLEEKQAMLEKMTELALERAMHQVSDLIAEKMTPEEVEQLNTASEQEQYDRVMELVPNFEDILEAQMLLVKTELLELTNDINQA